jgi:hypothetical protein
MPSLVPPCLTVPLAVLLTSCAGGPLQVVLDPNPKPYAVSAEKDRLWTEDAYCLVVHVRNQSQKPYRYRYWSCAWYHNWMLDSYAFSVATWPCFGNSLGEMDLAPGETVTAMVTSPSRNVFGASCHGPLGSRERGEAAGRQGDLPQRTQ